MFSKKSLTIFFDPEKMKKRASKVAHNRSNPFFFTVPPRPEPTAQNWFFILWNLGTRHLFSYLCLKRGQIKKIKALFCVSYGLFDVTNFFYLTTLWVLGQKFLKFFHCKKIFWNYLTFRERTFQKWRLFITNFLWKYQWNLEAEFILSFW